MEQGTIRFATESDTEQIYHIWDRCFGQKEWALEDGLYLVHVKEQELIGATGLIRTPDEPVPYRIARTGVLPGYQRTGIMTELLQRAVQLSGGMPIACNAWHPGGMEHASLHALLTRLGFRNVLPEGRSRIQGITCREPRSCTGRLTGCYCCDDIYYRESVYGPACFLDYRDGDCIHLGCYLWGAVFTQISLELCPGHLTAKGFCRDNAELLPDVLDTLSSIVTCPIYVELPSDACEDGMLTAWGLSLVPGSHRKFNSRYWCHGYCGRDKIPAGGCACDYQLYLAGGTRA